jgi:hypothetical protein
MKPFKVKKSYRRMLLATRLAMLAMVPASVFVFRGEHPIESPDLLGMVGLLATFALGIPAFSMAIAARAEFEKFLQAFCQDAEGSEHYAKCRSRFLRYFFVDVFSITLGWRSPSGR